jgi:hypothetical protein
MRSTCAMRTSSIGIGSPTPQQCERIRLRCSSSRSPFAIATLFSFPNPVVRPYTTSPAST